MPRADGARFSVLMQLYGLTQVKLRRQQCAIVDASINEGVTWACTNGQGKLLSRD